MAQFEYRCRIHGRIRDVAEDKSVEPAETCPVTEGGVRCGLPLFVAEIGSISSDEPF